MNLQSSVNKQGKVVTQILHFSGGCKKTFHGVLTETIEDGTFTKFKLEDGRLIMVNGNNVNCIEVFTK